MEKKIILIIVSLIVSISLFAEFPQEKINKVIFEHKQNKTSNRSTENTSQHSMPFEMNNSRFDRNQLLPIKENLTFSDNRDILYIGPGADTIFITSDYVQGDDIVIFGQGVLIVDDAMLTLAGQFYIMDEGQAIFQNNAHLHFDQYYVGQYYLWMLDNSRFEATDATVDANGVMHYVHLYDYSTYVASNTYFPDWVFRKVFNTSELILEDVNHVGDILVDDSCFVHFTRCDTLMPWFEMPNGSVVNTQFPDQEFVEHFELSDDMPGVDGINYTFIADSCSQCWWSLETFTGCDVTINNSVIRGSCVRMFGSNTFHIEGIVDYSMHANLIVPLSDRNLVYNNTYVYWWNWYPFDDIIFNIDSCSFGEMIGRGNSETYATNCLHDGSTIMLGSSGDAFISFIDGISHSYVGTYENSTFLFINSKITPMWPYQSTNIAHDNSYLLAVNSYFEYEPTTMDSALVMFALIDSLSDHTVGETIQISGSAWIKSGDQRSINFDNYKLHYVLEGNPYWTLIDLSTTQVSHELLAEWDTSGLEEGDYDMMLTIYDSVGDSLIAFRSVTLLPSVGIDDAMINNNSQIAKLFGNFPNPFHPSTTISFSLTAENAKNAEIVIYNLKGQKVKTLIAFLNGGLGTRDSVTWDGTDENNKAVGSGIYFYELNVNGKTEAVNKCLLMK
jgi:hypothetical protein